MAENQDSGRVAGTSGDAKTAGSQNRGDQHGSGFDAAKLQSSVEALTKRLDEVDARSKSLQGDKDRGVNQTRQEVEELKRKIAEYEKLKSKGLELDEAVEELDFREAVYQLKDQISHLASVSGQVSGTGKSGAEETAAVDFATKYGLDTNDKEVADAVLRGDMGTLAIKYAAKLSSTSGSVANAPPLTGGNIGTTPSEQELEAEFQRRAMEIQNKHHGDEKTRLITALQLEFKEKGRKDKFVKITE